MGTRSSKVGWAATSFSLTGVAISTLLPSHIRWMFPIFVGANILWFTNGYLYRNRPQMALQTITGVLNVIAVYHWFF